MDNNILSALSAINVAELSRADWIAVGMALKEEGFPCSVWDDWSQNDSRYHAGECQKKWEGFHGTHKPVKAGTIIQMAKDRGWAPYTGEAGCMNWNDTIEYDGEDAFTGFPQETWNPVQDLITYLSVLFEPDDHVAYVTNDVWKNEDDKWVPSKGVYDRTRDDLIESLNKHPEDIGATIGDWKPEAGAWIRFNPVDGEGVKNENVTRFTYALIESDTMPIAEQNAMFRKMELPIAALVHSGGKSLHAIVHIDAKDADEYRRRVEFLYDFLEKHGVPIDKQNRNPSRLSRMPGVTRNGNRQYLVDTNIGRKSWNDWMDFAEGVDDELPALVDLAEYKDDPPTLPEELIEGILRRGHKMLLSGSSKAGKSFLLMELCIAIAEGKEWLGFPCRKGRVLYVNLEIDPASAINRFFKIYQALGIPMKHAEDIVIWNLRGHAIPLDQLVPKMVRRVRDQHLDAIIIDPIYKVITGDENNASDMGAFCNQFDRICAETGCAAIYCHHHSKGAQGMKKAMDRASGSGVFARDPDAQLDMIELELTDDIRDMIAEEGESAWRLESSLREFPNIKPVNFWFSYPIHRLDTTGDLANLGPEGSSVGNLTKTGNFSTPESRRTAFDNAYDVLSMDEDLQITVNDIAEYIGVAPRTVRRYLNEMKGAYNCTNGVVKRLRNAHGQPE